MKKKGFKKSKGEPAIWDEVKRACNLSLTPTAIGGLDILAKEFGYSRSEFVERIARRMIPVGSPSDTSRDTFSDTSEV